MKTLIRSFILLIFLSSVLPISSENVIGKYYMTSNAYTENFDQIGLLKRSDNKPCRLLKIKGSAAKFLYVKNNHIYIKESTAHKLFSKDSWDITLVISSGTAAKHDEISFKIIKDEFINNGVIAHRGYWFEKAPQNSMEAFRLSVDLGCAGTEFDVQLTKDKKLVLSHDAVFQGVDIPNTNFDEVRKIKLENGEVIPSFQELIAEGVMQNKTRLVTELKSSVKTAEEADEFVKAILTEVINHNAHEWMFYITFNKEILKSLIRMEPAAKIAYLSGDMSPEELKKIGCNIINYNAQVLKNNPQWFNEAKALGISMNVWTVNKREDMHYFLDRQIDRITTDHPDVLLDILKNER